MTGWARLRVKPLSKCHSTVVVLSVSCLPLSKCHSTVVLPVSCLPLSKCHSTVVVFICVMFTSVKMSQYCCCFYLSCLPLSKCHSTVVVFICVMFTYVKMSQYCCCFYLCHVYLCQNVTVLLLFYLCHVYLCQNVTVLLLFLSVSCLPLSKRHSTVVVFICVMFTSVKTSQYCCCFYLCHVYFCQNVTVLLLFLSVSCLPLSKRHSTVVVFICVMFTSVKTSQYCCCFICVMFTSVKMSQ